MWVFLEPHDRWLFRDARPFTAGEAFRARSQWPPSPAPVAGAVKTWLIKRRGVDPEKFAQAIRSGCAPSVVNSVLEEVGGSDDMGRLRLKGPLVCRCDGEQAEPLFPLPRDLVGTTALDLLRPLPSPLRLGLGVRASKLVLQLTWASSLTWTGEDSDYVLTLDGLRAYLHGRAPGMNQLVRMTDLAGEERHVGIRLQPSRRQAEAGMLYAAQFVRPRDRVEQSAYWRVGLLVEVKHGCGDGHLDGLDGSSLWLGGERRSATTVKLSQDPLKSVLGLWDNRRPEGRVVVYLLTPGVFENGWRPDALDGDGILTCDETRLKLEAATVGKPIPLARWDLAWNRPRALYRAVPPGSVYIFSLLEGNASKAVQCLHGTTFLQERAGGELGALHQMGFGWTMVGERT